MTEIVLPADRIAGRMTGEERLVVLASSVGTVFEWYDFLVFASLSAIIGQKFFAALSPSWGFIVALITYSVGYVVRPLGAIVFGRLGDQMGRKRTFLITVSIMGTTTFLVGLLPTYATWGVAAPILLLLLRVVQGLSLGGEFGGAVTYVAEHAPENRRGYFTSWINCTSAVGLVLSTLLILGTRTALGDQQFNDWGWRIPFLLSLLLLVISVWIRLKLSESPIFQAMKEGKTLSKAPLRQAFGNKKNIKLAVAAMFGCVAGSAAVSSTGLIYPLLFLGQTLKVDPLTVNLLVSLAIAVTVPLFPLVGWISDHIGRKPVIVTGCLLGAVTFYPAIKLLVHFASPAYESAIRDAPVTVFVDRDHCSVMFDPTGTAKFLSSCDIARSLLSRSGVSYQIQSAEPNAPAYVTIGATHINAPDGNSLPPAEFKAKVDSFNAAVLQSIRSAGYPAKADPAQMNLVMVWLVMAYLAALVPIAYGVVGALMVELFPASIRYTAMSLPYHFANGWVAGLLPAAMFALVAANGNIYFGLWYPIFWAALGGVVTLLFVPETKDRKFEGWHS
jgi:MFS family permease